MIQRYAQFCFCFFLNKVLGLVSPPYSVHAFSRKIMELFFELSFIPGYPTLLKIWLHWMSVPLNLKEFFQILFLWNTSRQKVDFSGAVSVPVSRQCCKVTNSFHFQNQSAEVFYKTRYSLKCREIHRNTCVKDMSHEWQRHI